MRKFITTAVAALAALVIGAKWGEVEARGGGGGGGGGGAVVVTRPVVVVPRGAAPRVATPGAKAGATSRVVVPRGATGGTKVVAPGPETVKRAGVRSKLVPRSKSVRYAQTTYIPADRCSSYARLASGAASNAYWQKRHQACLNQ